MKALLLTAALLSAAAQGQTLSADLRARWEQRDANPAGLLAAVNTLAAGLAPPVRSGTTLEAEVRGQYKGLSGNLLLQHERLTNGDEATRARINEAALSGALPTAAWHYSVGRKIVAWDVGYGWRPNDVVQQEPRRLLYGATPQGRPLLQVERFDADSALALVWVNPTHLNGGLQRRLGAEESALALRAYRRDGAVDWHGFARLGEHTGASLGAAVAWVANDELELHASARWAQRHDGWASPSLGPAELATNNPWQLQTQGGTGQALVGLSWTNDQQLGLLAEAWHDGSTLSDAAWSRWTQRREALMAFGATPALPANARLATAGNLAWQATPWTSQNLRRDNLFTRLSWQHEAWQPALDLLFTPADSGRTVTASLAWQGDRLRLEGGWRRYGGPSTALLAQLPQRQGGYLMLVLPI
jgi:hypothetical protein